MKSTTRVTLTFTAMMVLTGLLSSTASAQTAASGAAATPSKWAQEHPNRAEVVKRVDNQDKRIAKEKREGELTKGQAKKLRANDNQIHREEKAMARQDGGHITGSEKKALNTQLNENSRAINKASGN